MPPLTGGHAVFEDNNEDMAKRAACRRGRGFQARGTKTGTRRMPNDQNPSKKEASQQTHHGSSSAHTPASEPASPKPAAASDAASPEPARIYIKEVEGHQARYRKLIQLTHSSTKAAGAMLLAAVVALVVANVGAYEGFLAFWQTEVGVFFGSMEAEMSLAHIINDIFMAVFFLLVGLEIKYEMTVGELTNIRQALLPIVAACGGVVAPILIYLAFNGGNPDTSHGWGVPTATDIAFALGIMALLGNRVPNGVRVFLSTLAVADDIIAILVIAIFYGHSPSLFWLGCAAGVFVVLLIMNRSHIYSLVPYLLVGVALWYCVFMSGVHSTIAGVLLAFAIPTGSRVNLKSFISWSGGKVREARDAFDDATPVMGQQDYLKTVQSLSNVARQVVPPARVWSTSCTRGCTSASCRCSRSRTPTSASSAAIWGPCSPTRCSTGCSSAFWWASPWASCCSASSW